jgi:Protein of unknown function (DUF2877)
MLDVMSRATPRASLIGPIAARALREGAAGSVRAVFDRSLYLSLHDAWICAGATSLGAGPLNVVCEDWPADGRSSNALLMVGDAAKVENGVLHAGRIAIPLATAGRWHPKSAPGWGRASLARGLAAFDHALPPNLPRDGLARLLRASETGDTPILAAARIATRHLTQLLHSAAAGNVRDFDAAPIAALIGLGPGLTPAGDDYLGGVLVTLSLTAQLPLRDGIWGMLQSQLPEKTNEISRAHLRAAAEGLGGAALHGLLNAILAGACYAIPAGLEAATAIGHTSGWDGVAGAITVLHAQ